MKLYINAMKITNNAKSPLHLGLIEMEKDTFGELGANPHPLQFYSR